MSSVYFAAVFFLCGIFAHGLTPCTTPNGEAASCVSLLRCRVLLPAAASGDPLTSRFFSESVCDEKTSSVCCGTVGNYTTIPTRRKPLNKVQMFNSLSKEGKKEYVLERLLPTTTHCGLQHTDDYFYNETETSVDEFPWLVYIMNEVVHEISNFSRVEVNCAGALISNRYVLSTTDCSFPGWYDRLENNVNMLLGVHHIHKDVNCIGIPIGIEDCNAPPLLVSSKQWKIYEDVMLLRLTKKIDYTDYVRPICLPLHADEIPTAGSLVVASGWSEEELVRGNSLKLKKRMKYTAMNTTECETNNSIKNPICGVPLQNNPHNICTRDIGGALMYRHRRRNWFAVGLLRNVSGLCNEAQPAIASRLTPEIVKWIIENIEP